jgi:hypothetical protein
MIRIDLSELKKLEKALKEEVPKAFKFAQRDAINSAAFEGRRIWQEELRSDLTLRNRYTLSSVRVEPTRTLNPNRMVAVLGSVAPYMGRLEHGGIEHGARPTEVAAGQAMGSQPRTKLVRAPNKLAAIRLTNRHKSGGRKLRNMINIRRAVEAGQKFVLLETTRGEGLFKITGRRRNLQVRQVWDFSQKTYNVPAHPTLESTLGILEKRMDRITRDALLRQLKRHGVFGY